jgi:hypothetical protein
MDASVSGVLEGPIRQVGYIVRDLDAAMRSWSLLGVGPWFTGRDVEQRCRFRGELCEVTISIALANSGPMQIELIEQIDDGPSIYREFLDSGGEGYQQLAWWVRDFDALLRRAEAAGWPIVFSDLDGEYRFAYFELDPQISTVVEVMELTDATEGLFEIVAQAAASWDGVTEPVRSLPLGT